MITRTTAAFLCLAGLTFSAFADIQGATDALNRGDYAGAAREFQRLAEQGDARAQAHLGYLYYAGEGVQQSHAEAVRWYRAAADQGHRDAQYNLATAYAFGEGVPQDYREAALWYRRAGEQGHALAQYSLGISYSYGEGVKQDAAEAARWFRLAAEQGYVRAQVQLGSKYHLGDGVEQNYQEAVKWYRMAADRGDAAAQYNLGSMYRAGHGVTQDYNQALRWYRLAADQGYAAAQTELASMERTMAAASRPRPAAPAEQAKPLFSVDESSLLSLEEGEAEAAPAPVPPASAEASPAAVPAETAAAPAAAVEAAADTGQTAAAVAEEASPRPGFFARLFGRDAQQTGEGAAEPAPVVEESAAEATAETEDAAPPAGEMLAMEGVDHRLPEVAATAPLEDVEADADTADEARTPVEESAADPEPAARPGPLRGFFGRLFGRDRDSSEESADVESAPEELAAAGAEPPAPVDEEPQDTGSGPAADAQTIQTPEGVEDFPAAEAESTGEEENKPGFFRRLFGKDDGEDVAMAGAPAESPAPAAAQAASEDWHTETIEARPADPVQLAAALDLVEQGRFAEALPDLESMAEAGDPVAQLQTASLYHQGLGVDRDVETAARWYRRAAERGNADAQYSLGNMYLLGEGVGQDDAQAGRWYRLAAAQGHTGAQHNLANLERVGKEAGAPLEVVEGDEVPEDEVGGGTGKKPGLFRRLFGKKDQTAVAATPADPSPVVAEEPAPEPEQPAARTEEEPAVAGRVQEEKKERGFFGRIFGRDDDEPADDPDGEAGAAEPEPAAEPEQAAEPEHAFGSAPAETAAPAPAAPDPEQAYQQGIAHSFGDGVPQDHAVAFQWYLTAAEQGHAAAQYKVGVAYAYGEGVASDPGLAAEWYRRAGVQGYAVAQRNLGSLYLAGEGVERNPPMALAWYSLLAESGNPMDVRRRDQLAGELSEAELAEARQYLLELKTQMTTAR